MVHFNSPDVVVEQDALYLRDTYLTEVTAGVAATGREDDGTAWVALQQNLFHPQGGGQPADRGWLGSCEVVPARYAPTGLVVLRARHSTEDDLVGLSAGDLVHARVDADLRLLHAALHTAGHLIEAAARTEGWTLTGNNHFPGQARIELDATRADPELDTAEGREKIADRLRVFVATAIGDDLPVAADHDQDGRRIVHLGDLHAAPCGGTHVRSLADLAQVTISGVKQKKGRVRVSYTASHRPRS
ncbi:hypothetical protein [Sphaerisporangium fuscum]|uniref:hypothetical protein n=1 Tax=Sphaerisporangium fuscum TaxID=2835868 RepID=UPI001BDD02DA|nr:hypothetical protein [Sphaerisporangium fuscum]